MRILKFVIPGVLLAFVLGACSDIDKVGPELNGIYSKVQIAESLTVSKSNPSFFASEKVAFSAKFAKDTYWVLTIKGNTSGATKTFTGTSPEISPSRIVWDGTSDGPGSFAAETAVAKVKFPYSPEDSMSVNITITAPRNPTKGGIMISDFNTFAFGAIDYPTGEIGNLNNTYPKIAGNYAIMRGTAKPGSGNFAGYLGITAVEAGYIGGRFPLYANGDLVYFNMMVYGTGDQVRMQVVLQENGVEARYINIVPNWIGWKLVSVRYTDFTPSVVSTVNFLNPQNVTGVGMIYFSNEPVLTTEVSFPFDRMIFTHNGPYQP